MKKLLLTGLIINLLIGCGAKTEIQGNNAKSLYENTVNELAKDEGGFPWIFNSIDFDTVEEQLKEIQIRYTYSPYATLAELRTADVYFKRQEYRLAATEYEQFIERHPTHNGTPYAKYFLALSNYRLIRGYDTSPKSARESVIWFNQYVAEYPESPLAPDAMEKIDETKEILAEREIYIGNFYLRKKNPKAAAARYKTVTEEYPDSKHLDEALYLLGKSYIELNENELALTALNRIINDMPDSKYNNDAKQLASTIK